MTQEPFFHSSVAKSSLVDRQRGTLICGGEARVEKSDGALHAEPTGNTDRPEDLEPAIDEPLLVPSEEFPPEEQSVLISPTDAQGRITQINVPEAWLARALRTPADQRARFEAEFTAFHDGFADEVGITVPRQYRVVHGVRR